MPSLGRDLLSTVIPVYAGGVTQVTAGGAGDGVTVNGTAVVLADRSRAESVAVMVPFAAILGEDETLTVTLKLQDSPDGTTWSDVIRSGETATTATGGTGGSTETGQATIGVDLNAVSEQLRVVMTPEMSRADTDTATIGAVSVLLGGLAEL